MSAVDQHAEAHRLKTELGYGARRIAAELGITRHAATQLLSRPLSQPVAVVAAADGQERRPVAEMQLPHRVAQPLAGVDLSQWPAVRRDLADLVRCGRTAEAVAHMAITAMAHAYRQALARGDLEPGQRFIVSGMTLRPLPHPAARTTPAPAEGA